MKNTYTALGLLASFILVCQTSQAVYSAGDIAANFSLDNRLDGGSLDLHDYAGHIILLDFFAYWCGPCQTSSPDLEQNVSEYYKQQAGNINGIPVTVIAVNIENQNPANTDQFIENAGLQLVADDFTGLAWNHFGLGYIPHFVIINGVAGSPSHAQWEILHTNYGYKGATYYRGLIDSVEAPEIFDLSGWSSWDKYPHVYSSDHGWLYVQPTGEGLHIYKYQTGQWVFKN